MLLLCAIRAEVAQAFERPDPIGVAVRPVRLERVVADRFYGVENERLGRVALRLAAVHAAEEVGLAGADGAGARAAQVFERVV